MLKNYFKIAWRGFRNNKFYSFINLTGLTVSISVFIITGLYISNELSYGQNFKDADRIYRVFQQSDDEYYASTASLPPGVGSSLANRFPEVEATTELGIYDRLMIKPDGAVQYIPKVFPVDETFFDVFDVEILAGNAREALKSPGNILLTASQAMRLFGTVDVVGKTIPLNDEKSITVAAVLADLPSNSHLTFDALTSLSTNARNSRAGDIRWNFFQGGYVYMKISPDANVNELAAKISEFEEGSNKPEWMEGENVLALQSMLSIHLGQIMGNDHAPQGNKVLLYLFGAIAVLLLGLSCINYMNLSSAKAVDRSKEVGVRKTFGAIRSQLIAQFLSESVLTALITLPLSLFLVEFCLPYINNFLGTKLELLGPQYLPFLIAIPFLILLTGLISGSYSALFLASVNPHSALKSQSLPTRGALLRKSLMVFQFAASLFLVISTITIYKQLNYIQNKNLGFEKEEIITFNSRKLGDDYEAFRQNLNSIPGIVNFTSGPPAGTGFRNFTVQFVDPETEEVAFVNQLVVDYNYTEAFDLELVSGRSFSRDFSTDPEKAMLLNEAALKTLGLEDKAVGDFFTFQGEERQLIGVLKDFHHSSLYTKIEPYVISLSPGNNNTGIIRLAQGNPDETIAAIKNTWSAFVPQQPFEFSFLDVRIDRAYQKEHKLVFLFSVFTGIALLVACLGLLGMAAFSAQKRKKEIGIRKVLGASVSGILSLLSKDFVVLTVFGLVIAAPVSYLAIQKWLSAFAYSVPIQLTTFVLAFALILLVTLISVGIQGLRAASINPVKSLKNE